MDDIRKILGIKPYRESDFDFARGTSTALIGSAGGLLFLGLLISSVDMVYSGICLTIMGALAVGNTILIRRVLERGNRGRNNTP